MNQTELSYFAVLAAVILLSQFAPTQLLLLLDHLVIRIVVVLLLLYLMRVGPTAGIFGLMAIAILYLERNRRKVAEAILKIDRMDSNYMKQATVEEASQPQTTVPVAAFDLPESFEMDFLPTEASDSAFFEPVAETINQKAVLSTIYPSGSGSAAESLYEELGFGHVDGVTTLGSSH